MKLSLLLSKTSELEIFLHFLNHLDENHIRKKGNPGRNISSPFQKDDNPSCSIYEDDAQKLKYKCHASGRGGDCFQLVADLHQLDCRSEFNEVLKLINDRMKLGLENVSTRYQSKVWKTDYYEGFTKKAKDFWLDRAVDIATLERFGVRQLKSLVFTHPVTKKVSTYYFHQKGLTAFEYTVNRRKKLYVPSKPNPQLKKKFYCKTQNNNDIFGLHQLPKKKQKFLLILEGEPDVLCAVASGIPAVCFQSANVHVTKQQIRTLRRKASNLVLCYDLDKAGRAAIAKLRNQFPCLINLDIPKDSTGFVINGKAEENDETKIGTVCYEMAAKGAKVETYKDLCDWLPNAMVSDFRLMINRVIKDGRKKQFLHLWEQGFSYMKFNKKAGEVEQISNFLLEADAQILKEQASLRLVRFVSREYTTDTLAVPSPIFNSPDKLSDYLTTLRGNFRFNGTKKDLMTIQQMTFELADHLEEVKMMGWNKKHHCFVLSNAVLNGAVEAPNAEGILKGMYIPVANDANLDNSTYASDQKFRLLDDSKYKAPHQLFSIITRSYSQEMAIITFAFIFAGLFFDWIARKGMPNQFPLMGIFGQKGCGKGSLVKLLMKLFTSDPEEVSITNTTKTGFIRILEQASNIPALLDEFRNTVKPEKIEALKNIYDLIGKVIGVKSNDSRTKRSKILRPTFLFGQEAPVNEALFSRLIAINMAITEKTPKQIRQFSADMAELDKGIGGILFNLLGYREVVIQHFKATFFELVEHFGDKVAEKGIKANTRLLNNYACIIAPLVIALKNGLNLMDEKGKNGPTDWTPAKQILVVKRMALRTLINQASEESQLDEVNKFLEVVMIAATRSKPLLFPGHDFVAHEAKGELIIKAGVLSEFNDLYEKIYKHKGPDQSAIKKYIVHKPYFIQKRRVYFLVTGSDNNPKNAKKTQLWGYVLDLKKLPEETSHYFNAIAKTLKKQTAYAIAN